MLPGGGVDSHERSRTAAKREIYEETGLHTLKIKYLFKFKGKHNYHKVFFVQAQGKLRKRNEIKHIAFWNENSKNKLSVAPHVKKILSKLTSSIFYSTTRRH